MASKHSDFLCEMFGRHLGFFRQRKVRERNKFLPRGWLVGKRKEGGGGGEEKKCRKSNMAAQLTMALALPNKTAALQAMLRSVRDLIFASLPQATEIIVKNDNKQ